MSFDMFAGIAQFMMNVSKCHSRKDQNWNRWSDEPLNGTFESCVHSAKFFSISLAESD